MIAQLTQRVRRWGNRCHAHGPHAGGGWRGDRHRAGPVFSGLLYTEYRGHFCCPGRLRQSLYRAKHAKRAGQNRQRSDAGEGAHLSVLFGLESPWARSPHRNSMHQPPPGDCVS
jgi:hypothetical protein